MPRVAIIDDHPRLAEPFVDWFAALPGCDVEVIGDRGRADVWLERLAPFEIVVEMRQDATFGAAEFAALPSLRLLVTTGMRNALIDLDAATRAGVTVCGTGGIASATVEHTWALILSLARHVPAEDAQLRNGGWSHTVGVDLAGATLGLLGLGRMGAAVGAIGRAFGMRVIAWSPNLTAERAEAGGAELVSKEQLLAESDVLSVHLVLGDSTRHILDRDELRAMRPTALLINTSRGALIRDDALITALREGWIAGAALDVFVDEPLPSDSPLRALPRTVLTPHVAYITRAMLEQFTRDAIEDVLAFVDGQPQRVLNG